MTKRALFAHRNWDLVDIAHLRQESQNSKFGIF